MTKALMFQGTGSNVGKSLLVAGLCRAARQRGLNVAPFKPQNMSNNAAVTDNGGEIGRAQALQARACHLPPHTDMNPVLLKPENETGAQVIVHGKRLTTARARDYSALKPKLLPSVLESFHRLKSHHDLVIVEGAGSPAEVNLRKGDIANMGFAQAARVPVILCGDIDRGGVIAQIVGTHAVLNDEDRALIQGFLINKFRGDPRLFDDGYSLIQTLTGWQGFGVAPWYSDAWKLPAEDAQDIQSPIKLRGFHVVCLRLSRIANFDDLDPLAQEKDVRLTILEPGRALPGDTDLVILPGSKSTRGDLAFLRTQGWDIDLQAYHRRGGKILGICGGYQMLGQNILDPDGIEGAVGDTKGLGFLDIETKMGGDKSLRQVIAKHIESGTSLTGYEIHIGQTVGPDCALPFAKINDRLDGAVSADGRVMGTYLHGMFSDDQFRATFLKSLGAQVSNLSYETEVDHVLDGLARHLEENLDIDGLLNLAR